MKLFPLLGLAISALFASHDVYVTFEVKALQDATLMLPSPGVIVAIHATTSDHVKQGQLLLSLENSDKKEQLRIAQSQLLGAQEQYLFAKAQYERYEKAKGAIDANTYERIKTDYLLKEQELKGAKSALALHQALLGQTILKAPFDGIIAAKTVEIGDGVAANSTPLFRLISHTRKLVISFDSKYLSLVRTGQTLAYSIDGSDYSRKATLSKIYPSVDSKNRKAYAEAIIETLEPGIFGDGYIRIP